MERTARPAHEPDIFAAYGTGAAAWSAGPESAYVRFAHALIAASPVPLAGRRIVDVGAGTGAVSAALRAAGALPVAVDGSPAMLATARRVPYRLDATVADGVALPIRSHSVGGVVSGFCLNHLRQPHRLLLEARRVAAPGAVVLASTFARGENHPAKAAVDAVVRAWGWVPPEWYRAQRRWAALTDTAPGLYEAARRAGLPEAQVHTVVVDAGVRHPDALVAWRLGHAHLAGFVAGMDPDSRARMVADARAAVGPAPQPLRRAVLILSSHLPA